MTDQELRDIVAKLALDTQAFKEQLIASREETDRRWAEADKRRVEDDIRETIAKAERDRSMKKLERQTRELGKQIGGLGNKFGRFTEGIALPSVNRLLRKRFGVEDFIARREKRVGAETIQLDAIGIVNGERNEGYVVEIKSHLRSDAIQQMRSVLNRFRGMFPELSYLKLYGILVAADAGPEVVQEARDLGFYLITFEENIMHFHDENGFVPKAY
jgi:hypothetical protein